MKASGEKLPKEIFKGVRQFVSFEAKVCAQYEAWMVNGLFTYMPSRKKRSPSKEMVLWWIDRAWNEIPVELITKSFKSCDITNASDGTEDEAVWEEEREEAEDPEDDAIDNEFETESKGEDDE